MFTRLAAILVVLVTFSAVGAQEPAASADPLASLKAELTVEREVYYPGQPLNVRFTLFNPTDEAIDVPLPPGTDVGDAVTLPLRLITGTSAEPSLWLAYEDERAIPFGTSSLETDDGKTGALRLEAHTAVGRALDLAALQRGLRYSGEYRLTWQPLHAHVPEVTLDLRIESRKDVVMVTDFGNMTFTLMYDEAPRNVENFLELVRDRFYDRKTFHRIIPGFILQGGSSDGTNKGLRPDGKLVPGEFHDAPFEVGTLAMARKPSDPDSASCQFFISLARNPELDTDYTVIGQTRDEESVRTLQKLAELPTNKKGEPLRPVRIRVMTLVDTTAGGPTRQMNVNER
nr:peptidylprolyl isomerase [uncultured Ilyobacter sp.]